MLAQPQSKPTESNDVIFAAEGRSEQVFLGKLSLDVPRFIHSFIPQQSPKPFFSLAFVTHS
jgi:hypothetical protein